MFSNTEFFENIYDAFNQREIETVLSVMADDVKWANGMEGGFVYGRENVREYWRKQFEIIKPQLETLEFETVNDRCVVKLRQTVRDLSDNILDEKIVEHIFTFENGLIKTFEIGNFTKPLTDNENFQKLQNRS